MNARLLPRDVAKGATPENIEKGGEEARRCREMGIEPGTVLRLEDMVRNDSSIISITGITDGNLVSGVTLNGSLARTETLLIRSSSRTIRRINSLHQLNRKSSTLYELVFGKEKEQASS